MSSATISSARAGSIDTGRLLWAAPLAGVIAAIANIVVYYVASAFGIDFTMPFQGPGAPPAELPVAIVAIASFVPALAAGALLWLLGRFTARATTIFVAVAAIFGLLSLGGPASLPIGGALMATLALMHVVAGVVIAYVLISRSRAR